MCVCVCVYSTLQFTVRAKNIKNKPILNQKMTQRAYMNELLQQIQAGRRGASAAAANRTRSRRAPARTQTLKREVEVLRTKNGIILPPEQFEELQKELVSKRRQVEEFESRCWRGKRGADCAEPSS